MANANWKTKLGVVRVDRIHRFRFHKQDGTAVVLDFISVNDVPGFTHRVAMDGKLTSRYLGADFPVNERNALDMLDLITAGA